MNGVRWLAPAAAAAILVSMGPVATASATPGVDVEVETLSQATVNGKDYVTKQITIAPGGSTGWHWHPGEVYGVIQRGHADALHGELRGSTAAYPAGITRHRGHRPGQRAPSAVNLGPDPVVMWVNYIEPAGGPLTPATCRIPAARFE